MTKPYTPLSLARARAMVRDLAAREGAEVFDSSGTALTAARALVTALSYLRPEAEQAAKIVSQHLDDVSITLPVGDLGTFIFLSDAVEANALDYASTGNHEVHHAHGIAQSGTKQTVMDYLGDRNLRAAEEARAEVVAIFTRQLFSGVIPDPEQASAGLSSRIYFLGAPHVALGHEIIAGAIESMKHGTIPNNATCVSVYQWATHHAPECIAVDVRVG